MSKLERPSARVLNAYQNWFRGEKGEDFVLGGKAKSMLDADDQATLKGANDQDLLSNLLQDHWPFSVHGDPLDHEDHARHFKERQVILVVNVISTSVSAVLLIGSILGLYIVTTPNARLAMVIGFIVLFAIALAVTTSASREAVFAATAAYAAVLVVFVSGNLGNAQLVPGTPG